MDANTRDLALIAVLSLFCAGFAWAEDRDIFGSVFFSLGVVAILGGSGTDNRYTKRKAPPCWWETGLRCL